MNGHEENVAIVPLQPFHCISSGWDLIKDEYLLFLGITLVGVFLGGLVPFGIIAGALYCGIFLSLLMKMRGLPVEFGVLFKGFDYFLESLLVTLAIFVISAVCSVLMIIAMLGIFAIAGGIGKSANSGELALLCILPGGFVFFLTVFAVSILLYGWMFFSYPLLVDRNMQAWPALKLSARAVWANKWGVAGLMLLNSIFGLVGTLLCFVGLFLYTPVMFASFAVAYRKLFPELPQSDTRVS